MTDRFVAAVLITLPAPEAPIDPLPDVRSIVVAVKVPVVSVIAPAALRFIVPILLLPPTLPSTAILPEVVVRLRTSPDPTTIVVGARFTEPVSERRTVLESK